MITLLLNGSTICRRRSMAVTSRRRLHSARPSRFSSASYNHSGLYTLVCRLFQLMLILTQSLVASYRVQHLRLDDHHLYVLPTPPD